MLKSLHDSKFDWFKPLKPRFIRPMSIDWVDRASKLPGKALHVAVALWRQAGLESSATITLSMKPLRENYISRQAVYNALRAMEKAGLIKVERRNGVLPTVTILVGRTLDG